MSRVGNNPISIPNDVTVEIMPDILTVKGKLGELSQNYDTISVEKSDNELIVKRSTESK